MKYSIIIAVYNRLEEVKELLESAEKLIRILKYRWPGTIMKKLSPIYMIIVLLSDRTSRKKCVCVVLPRTSVLIIIPAVRKPIPTRLLSLILQKQPG